MKAACISHHSNPTESSRSGLFWNPLVGPVRVQGFIYSKPIHTLAYKTSENLIMGEVFIQCEMQSYKLVSLGKLLPYCVKGSALGAVCVFSLDLDSSMGSHLFSCFKEQTGIREFNNVINITYPGPEFER